MGFCEEDIRALRAALPFLPPSRRRALEACVAIMALSAFEEGEDEAFCAGAPAEVREGQLLRAFCDELTGERRARVESLLMLNEMTSAMRQNRPPSAWGAEP